jgi:hypothetical protein
LDPTETFVIVYVQVYTAFASGTSVATCVRMIADPPKPVRVDVWSAMTAVGTIRHSRPRLS